jgi:hypothetical protein
MNVDKMVVDAPTGEGEIGGGEQLGMLEIKRDDKKNIITLTFDVQPGPDLEVRTFSAVSGNIQIVFGKKKA